VTLAENKYKDNYGMVRVVPPKSWKPSSKAFKDNLDNLLVNGPIEQNIYGKGGVYEAIHIQKKSMTLKEYKEKVCPFDKMTEGLSVDDAEAKVNRFINIVLEKYLLFPSFVWG
jgi:jumonji domain-containing protein 2